LRDEAARAFVVRQGQLPQLAERAVEEVAEAEVRAWLEAAGAVANTLSSLDQERGGLAQQLADARRGSSFADALARVHAAEEQIAAAHGRAAEDALALMLLDEAKEQHTAEHAPRLLRRAQERFAAFTQQAFLLEVGSDGSFRARASATGEQLTLEQLSDGTRIHLLLAARLAAIEEAEAGSPLGPLPLCLDEVLATTDPMRFRQVAAALFAVVGAGRQIVYLTAGPAEAGQWRLAARELGVDEPTFVDLAVLRGLPADWGGALPAAPGTPEPLPELEGLSAEQCARVLGVAAPDGFAEWQSWHVFYLLHDDRDALRESMRRRIVTLGHWDAANRERLPGAGWSLRLGLLREVGRLWRIGRGRPVGWDDVMASGAVSPIYEERMRGLLAEHARAARSFLDSLRSGALERFRKDKIDMLEATLRERGCLVDDEPLAQDEIVRRALATGGDAGFVEWIAGLLGE
jgi:hypothetical protein